MVKEQRSARDPLDAIPQGSWAHETIIQPGPNLEFDADFLLQLDEVTDWSPRQYNAKALRAQVHIT